MAAVVSDPFHVNCMLQLCLQSCLIVTAADEIFVFNHRNEIYRAVCSSGFDFVVPGK